MPAVVVGRRDPVERRGGGGDVAGCAEVRRRFGAGRRATGGGRRRRRCADVPARQYGRAVRTHRHVCRGRRGRGRRPPSPRRSRCSKWTANACARRSYRPPSARPRSAGEVGDRRQRHRRRSDRQAHAHAAPAVRHSGARRPEDSGVRHGLAREPDRRTRDRVAVAGRESARAGDVGRRQTPAGSTRRAHGRRRAGRPAQLRRHRCRSRPRRCGDALPQRADRRRRQPHRGAADHRRVGNDARRPRAFLRHAGARGTRSGAFVSDRRRHHAVGDRGAAGRPLRRAGASRHDRRVRRGAAVSHARADRATLGQAVTPKTEHDTYLVRDDGIAYVELQPTTDSGRAQLDILVRRLPHRDGRVRESRRRRATGYWSASAKAPSATTSSRATWRR